MKNLYILFICLFSLSLSQVNAQNISDCMCTEEYDPVCGADGITYGNFCFSTCENIEISYFGACIEQPITATAGENYSTTVNLGLDTSPVDGPYLFLWSAPDWAEASVSSYDPNNTLAMNDNILYIDGTPTSNDIGPNYFVIYAESAWTGDYNVYDTIIVNVLSADDCYCYMMYSPVCGEDGQTYGNICEAGCEDVAVAYEGECEEITPCLGDFDIIEQEYIAGFAGMMLHLQVQNTGNDLSTTMASVILANTCASNDQFTFDTWASGDIVDMYFNYSCMSMMPYIEPFEAVLVLSGATNCAQDISFVFDPQGNNATGCNDSVGIFYNEGSSWNIDDCTFCSCFNGEILCAIADCAMPPCEDPIYIDGQCCPICEEEIFGCTNPNAVNYNAEANIDDESCELDPNATSCTYYGETLELGETMTVNGELCTCQTFIVNEWGYNGGAQMFCVPLTDTLGCISSTEDFYPLGAFMEGDCEICQCVDQGIIANNPYWVCEEIADCGGNEVYGCTDNNSINYNPEATIDDGSCIPIFNMGCTADNGEMYPLGYVMEGECETCICGSYIDPSTYPEIYEWQCEEIADCGENDVYGCMDVSAINYNPEANIEDGSCIVFIEACTDDNGEMYPFGYTMEGECETCICEFYYDVFYNPFMEDEELFIWNCEEIADCGESDVYACSQIDCAPGFYCENGECYPETNLMGCTADNGELYPVGYAMEGECEICFCEQSLIAIFPPEFYWNCEEIADCGDCSQIDCEPGFYCENGECFPEIDLMGCTSDNGEVYPIGSVLEGECETCFCMPSIAASPLEGGQWFCEEIEDCGEPQDCETVYMHMSATYDSWYPGMTYSILDANGTIIVSGTNNTESSTDTLCLPASCNYQVMMDVDGVSPYGGCELAIWTLSNDSGEELASNISCDEYWENNNMTYYVDFEIGCSSECECPLDVWDPVCAENGETYSYSCFAECLDLEYEMGECSTVPDTSCICPLNYNPVCGSDGITYSNACFAGCEEVDFYEGECLPTSFCELLEVVAETIYTDNGAVQLNITIYNNSTNDINYPVFSLETANDYVSIQPIFENAYWLGSGESTTNSYNLTGGGSAVAFVEGTYYVSQLNQNAACAYPISFIYEPMWGGVGCYANGAFYPMGSTLTNDCETCYCPEIGDATVIPTWECTDVEDCGTNDPCDLIDCADGYECVNGDCISIEPQEYGCTEDDQWYEFGSVIDQECNSCTCMPGFNPNAEGFWMCTQNPCEEECAEGEVSYEVVANFNGMDGGSFTVNVGAETYSITQPANSLTDTLNFCASPYACIEIYALQTMTGPPFTHSLYANGVLVSENEESYHCDQDVAYILAMFDSYGDGWNGAELSITNSNEELVGIYTFNSGDFEIVELNLADGCYDIEVTEGGWPSEINWMITENLDPVLLEGGAPFSGVFALNTDCGITVEYGCELDGELYEFGSSIEQGCNMCYCQAGFNPNANGIWSCTEMACGGCTDPEALNYDEYAVEDNGSCEYETETTPNWGSPNTGSNHTLVLAENMLVELDGASLEAGDWIGVFYPLNGELVCAGYTVWDGGTTVIPAQGDDTTTEIQDGFNANQEFEWLVWDASANTTYSMDASYDTSMPNQELYATNGISTIVTLIAQPIIGEQELQLVEGWNLFSTYMVAEVMDVEELFAAFVEDVVIVKNYLGLAYLPEFNFNGVGDLLPGQGYQAKLNNINNLTIEGDYLTPEENPIDLVNGWNLIAYLRTEPADVIAVFEGIQELVIVKDNSGMAYLPEYGFNGIGDMVAGQAYQIKVLTAQQLQYLANNQSYRLEMTVVENNLQHYKMPLNTGSNMSLVIEANQLESLLDFGDEVAVYSNSNRLVGAFVYQDETIVIPVYGNDDYSKEEDGLLKNEALSLKYWSVDKGAEIALSTTWESSTGLFEQNSIQVASIENANSEFSKMEFKIIPNPATHSAALSFELTENSKVEIQVFNILGDILFKLDTQEYNKGENSINLNVENYSVGTYIIKLQTSNSVYTKRLLVQ